MKCDCHWADGRPAKCFSDISSIYGQGHFPLSLKHSKQCSTFREAKRFLLQENPRSAQFSMAMGTRLVNAVDISNVLPLCSDCRLQQHWQWVTRTDRQIRGRTDKRACFLIRSYFFVSLFSARQPPPLGHGPPPHSRGF